MVLGGLDKFAGVAPLGEAPELGAPAGMPAAGAELRAVGIVTCKYSCHTGSVQRTRTVSLEAKGWSTFKGF